MTLEITEISLKGNEKNLQSLYNEVYGDTPDRIPSIKELYWRYEENPFQSRVWVAKDGEKIIGLRPVIKRPVVIRKQQFNALHFMNVMVHPDYQGQGVFSRLMKSVWETHSQDGVMAYTYPNKNSVKSYRKWNDWYLATELPLWIRLVFPRDISSEKKLVRTGGAGLANSLKLLAKLNTKVNRNSFDIKSQSYFDNRTDKLWSHNMYRYKMIHPRDSEYLNWRYARHPRWEYKIYCAEGGRGVKGYLVTRIRQMFGLKLGLLVDFFVEDDDATILCELIRTAVSELIMQGAEALGLQYTGPAKLQQAFLSNGFVKVPKQLLPREFLLFVKPALMSMEELPFSEQQGVYLTWGDNDAV